MQLQNEIETIRRKIERLGWPSVVVKIKY
jgi:hypothetical protein